MTELKVIVSKGCGGCRMLKSKYKEEIEEGKIKLVNADTEEGIEELKEMARQGLKLATVPQCIIRYDNGKYEKCSNEDIGEMVRSDETG